jgi:hypothetical protein
MGEDHGRSLAEDLADWTEWDIAALRLAQAIGLFEGQDLATQVKGLLWTDNPLGRGLHDALLALADAHILMRRQEPDEQFRWLGTVLGS